MDKIKEVKRLFLQDLFKETTYYEKVAKSNEGQKIVKSNKGDDGAYLVTKTIINNFGIAKAVRKQTIIYDGVMERQEIKNICNEIILMAVDDWELKPDCTEGQEINQLSAYVINRLDNRIKNYINEYNQAYRQRIGGQDNIITPDNLLSYDEIVLDEDGNEESYIDYISEEQNIFNTYDTYEPSASLKIILDTLKYDLSKEQQELMQILAYTDNNNAQAGQALKQLDKLLGKEIRSSDEAYRKYVTREKNKIIKLIDDNIDLNKVNKIVNLKQTSDYLSNFLESDLSERDVIDYTINNLAETYINSIIYNRLSISHRQYLIKNYIKDYKEDLFDTKATREVCRYILKELYTYNGAINKEIKNTNVEKIRREEPPKQVELKPRQEETEPITYQYYVEKDKFDKLYKHYKIKGIEIEILGEKKIKVKDYKTMDCYYLGEWTTQNKPRKQQYYRTNLAGLVYDIVG